MVAKRDSKLSSNGGWVAPTTVANSQPPTLNQRQNASTPVVSLLKLQQMGEELDICPSKKSSSPTVQDYMTTPPPQQTYYHQVPPPILNPHKSQTSLMPVLYQSVPPVFVAATGQPSGTSSYMNQLPPTGIVNGHSDQSGSNYPGQFQNHRASYVSKPYTNRRGGGGSCGNHSSPMSVHIPPFPPKFHFLNSNHMPVSGVSNLHAQGFSQKRHYNNRNQNQQHRGRDCGRYVGPNSGRMQRRFFPTSASLVNKNSSPCVVSTSNVGATAESTVTQATSTAITTATTTTTTIPATTAATISTDAPSPPPAPYSPMTHPAIDSSSPPQQMQFYSSTGSSTGHPTYYPPSSGAPQQLPVLPRRFVNSTRKSGSGTSNGGNTLNNGSSRSNTGSNGKYSKTMLNSMQVLSAAGNSGSNKMMSGVDEGSLGGAGDAPTMIAPPSCAVMQEACHQLQTLSL